MTQTDQPVSSPGPSAGHAGDDAAEAALSFTGERVVPGQVEPDLYYEHVTRYQFAAALAQGRRVLDAGCGAGYGTRLLAQGGAANVVGLDVSLEAVRYARTKFGGPRQHYVAGDCRRMPLPDRAFQLIVAFEVIEHLPDAAAFIRELARVLAPDGVLVLSTPNKRRYSDDRPGYVNPFHVREFYFEEWRGLLEATFPAVRHLDQGYVQAMGFSPRVREPNGRHAGPGTNGAHAPIEMPPLTDRVAQANASAPGGTGAGETEPEFFVAVCAHDAAALPPVAPRMYLLSGSNVVPEKERFISALQAQVREAQDQIVRANQVIEDLNRELRERTAWALEIEGRAERAGEPAANASSGPPAGPDIPGELARLVAEVSRLSGQVSELRQAAASRADAVTQELREALGELRQRAHERVDDSPLRRAIVEAREDHARRAEELRESIMEWELLLASSLRGADVEAGNRAASLQLARDIRRLISSAVPRGANVLVISKGDHALLRLGDVRAEHFPQTADGTYAGFHPANSSVAIIHLEALRGAGAQFLLVPPPSAWWLGHYGAFAQYLERYYRSLVNRDGLALYDLRPVPPGGGTWQQEFERALEACRRQTGREPAVLDWNTGLELSAVSPGRVFTPADATSWPTAAGTTGGGADRRPSPRLPYLDASIDVVAIRATASETESQDEAWRVAADAVLIFGAPGGAGARAGLEVRWKATARDEGSEPAPAGTRGPLPATRPPPLSASIIIPVYNGLEHTARCLACLQETLPEDFAGEVVVVNDASTDATADALAQWVERDARVRVVHNATNAGFVTSCNRGAEAAKGDFLVFLNNDTLPQRGWLPALLETFDAFPDAGAVGGMLIYPDGRLQEAGGIIFSDGSGANFGRGDFDLDSPLYNFVRPVDYCSGALLATPRALFAQLGGFDARYRPAYYEDTDYCFKVHAAGREVYYQPFSRVIHLEGASCGTDTAGGVKRYQVVNRQTFAEKWAEALREQPHPVDLSGTAWRARLVVRTGFRGSAGAARPARGQIDVAGTVAGTLKPKRAKGGR